MEWIGLDWTGLDLSGLEWTGLEKIVSNTHTNSIGLGWKRSSKNVSSIVPPVGKGRVDHKLKSPTVVGVMSKSPGRLDWKRSSATQTQSIFSSFRKSLISNLAQEKWLHV